MIKHAFPPNDTCAAGHEAHRRPDLTGSLDNFAICVQNPMVLAEWELERLLEERSLQSRGQQAVLRGMLSFFLLSALLNSDEDVLEEMGTSAKVEDIAKGLVSAAMTCYGARVGCRYAYTYPPHVQQIGRIFVLQASKGPAGYLRVGPYSTGTCAPAAWSTRVRDCLARRQLGSRAGRAGRRGRKAHGRQRVAYSVSRVSRDPQDQKRRLDSFVRVRSYRWESHPPNSRC